MQGPTLKRIAAEAFTDAPAWFGRLVELINPFIGSVTSALAKGLTREENFASYIERATFRTSTVPLALKNRLANGARVKAVMPTGYLTPHPGDAPWSITWQEENGQIKVYFQGLPIDATTREIDLIVE